MRSTVISFLILIFIASTGTSVAQIPGDSLALWYKSSMGIYTDIFCSTEATVSGDTAYCWKDQSINALDAARQESASPMYQTDVINGFPAVRFDGTGGLGTLESEALSFTDMTIFVVASAPDQPEAHFSLASSDMPERFFVGKWSNDANENPTSPSVAYFRPTSSNFWRAVDHQTDASGFSFVLISATISDEGTSLSLNVQGIPSNESVFCSRIGLIRPCPGAPARNSRAGFIGQRESVTTYPLTGDVVEVIVYGGLALDQARRTIVENYLSSKYDLTINPPADFYAGDLESNGNFDFEVSGIGAEADSSQTSGYSSGLIIESANDALAPGAYLLAGHRTADGGASADALPAGIAQRTHRVWYLDKTSDVDAMLAFDFSNGGTSPDGAGYTLLYRSENTQDFTVLSSVATMSDDEVRFTLSNAELTDGFYALGTTDAAGSPLPVLPAAVIPTVSSGVATEPAELPIDHTLSAIYPNPFNPSASFDLSLSTPQEVRITVYDTIGREVALLHEGWLGAQSHSFTFNSADLPSGIYVISVSGEKFSDTRKAVLLK